MLVRIQANSKIALEVRELTNADETSLLQDFLNKDYQAFVAEYGDAFILIQGAGRPNEDGSPQIVQVSLVRLDDVNHPRPYRFKNYEDAKAFVTSLKDINFKPGRKVLTLATPEQVAIFMYEVQGQLSDGMWENASPRDHWIDWSRAEVRVGSPVGVNFYPRRNSYGLSRLLEYVGDRIEYIGRAAKAGMPLGIPKYFQEYKQDSLTEEEINKIDSAAYSQKDARKDLNAIAKAMKTYLQ